MFMAIALRWNARSPSKKKDQMINQSRKMALQNVNKIKGHKSIIIGFPRIIWTVSTTIIETHSPKRWLRLFSVCMCARALVLCFTTKLQAKHFVQNQPTITRKNINSILFWCEFHTLAASACLQTGIKHLRTVKNCLAIFATHLYFYTTSRHKSRCVFKAGRMKTGFVNYHLK